MQKHKYSALSQTAEHHNRSPLNELYVTLTPEYSCGITFDLGQQFFNVFVLGVGLEKMPFTITVCTVQKPCVFLLVFLELGDWYLGPD